MSYFTHLKRTAFLGLLASMFVGSPAFGAISLPSALELEKAIYFQNPAGEPVQIKAGIYEVEQNGETALNVIPVGSGAGDATPIQAIPSGHDQDIDANTAHLVPSPDNNADKQHLVFVTPEGLALESVGSYSGVFSRSAMTWGQEASGDEAASDNPLMVSFEKATFFKTAGGDPKAIQPGDYEVAIADDGLVLTPSGDTKGEAITIESEALGTSTATVIPDFADNSDLELLMVATAGGQSIAAVGSHTGTFPRGFGSFLKKVGGKVKSAAKGVANKAKKHVVRHVKKGVRIAHGHVKKHVKRAIHTAKKHGKKAVGKLRAHGKRFIQKHGKKMVSRIVNHGKKIVSKLCGKGKAGKCLDVIAKHGGKLLQGAGS